VPSLISLTQLNICCFAGSNWWALFYWTKYSSNKLIICTWFCSLWARVKF